MVNGEAGDLRRYRAHCDVIVMQRRFTGIHVSQLALIHMRKIIATKPRQNTYKRLPALESKIS